LFADTTMRPYYATLVCGKAAPDGRVEICNAVIAHRCTSRRVVSPIAATGLPVGMFCQEKYESAQFNLQQATVCCFKRTACPKRATLPIWNTATVGFTRC
jgi:hypothetical protein